MREQKNYADFYPQSNEIFIVEPSHNLVCCDCGLSHAVTLKTNWFSKKIYAKYSRNEVATQKNRKKRNIAIVSKDESK